MRSTIQEKPIIYIASTIDENYLLPFSVAVYSLLRNKGKDSRIEWTVFETGVPERTRAKFDRLYQDSDIRFHWVRQSMAEFERFPRIPRGVPTMYQRLIIPHHFPPEVETILYLDVDVLVLGNIEELFAIELGDRVIGAVQDMAIPTVASPMGVSRYKEMGIPPDTPLFNSGVLLINLILWRQQRISEKALAYLENGNGVGMMDQDALNAILHSSWKHLDYRWNVIGSVAGRNFFKAKKLDRAHYREAVKDPGIVHFGGYLKPWQIRRLGNRWDAVYKKILAQQPLDYHLNSTLKTNLYSLYDRYFRSLLYPLERTVWKNTQ